jgi:hypothetical protein
MRVIAQIPHAILGITLFSWNQKYLLKFEMGNLEQTYKIHELDTAGEAEVRAIAENPDFIKKVQARFEAMQAEWNEAFV